MSKIKVRFSNEKIVTPGGLSVIGMLIEKSGISGLLNKLPMFKKHKKTDENKEYNPDIVNSDVVSAYIGLLSQGKIEYEAVNEYKDDAESYCEMLGLTAIPSPETLRQRLDIIGNTMQSIVKESNIELLKVADVKMGTRLHDYVPLDVDVSPFDNSNSKKEGVSWTYKKHDGYSPIFANIGEEGYLLNLELRPGSQHSQNGTPEFLEETIRYGKELTSQKLLLRMDAGFDSADNIRLCMKEETRVHFIIKRNLRQEDIEMKSKRAKDMAERAKSDKSIESYVTSPREGKTIWIGSVYKNVDGIEERPIRIVYEVIERTITKAGQIMLAPETEVSEWWTDLDQTGEKGVTAKEIIEEYHDHATSEQFHSELKTDMDVERLPSKYFATNAGIMVLVMFAYNCLKIMGQESLNEDDSPLKRPVKRRRIKTVMKNLITYAVRVVKTGRQILLNLGCSNAWRYTFRRVFAAVAEY